jgi:5-methylcytosine-specific restriction endonuclease McrA
MGLQYRFGERNVHEFVSLFLAGRLNLEPGFQRQSVWSMTDRKKLIESLARQYPLPSVFLYRREDDRGKLVYDVIDGKQRLESILMFQGVGKFRGQRYAVRLRLGEDETYEAWDWRKLEKKRRQALIDGYEIQTVEIESDDLSEIVDLFVRINSTGKRLTSAERRHARFYHTDFLRRASVLANRYKKYCLRNRIFTTGEIGRMKHVELVCELMASIHATGLLNKKKALDDIIGGQNIDGRSLPRVYQDCVHTLNLMERMFPRLRETRFRNSAEFYSLFMYVWDLGGQGAVLLNARTNSQAEKLLIWLSTGVDQVRQQLREGKGATTEQRLFRDYLLTIQADTDSQAQRQRRRRLLGALFGEVFSKRKDRRRGFTSEQRRLLWHSDESKRCPNCNDVLTWDNFTIDHINPFARGGRSSLKNADLMCRTCNARKGARRPSRSRTGRPRRVSARAR